MPNPRLSSAAALAAIAAMAAIAPECTGNPISGAHGRRGRKQSCLRGLSSVGSMPSREWTPIVDLRMSYSQARALFLRKSMGKRAHYRERGRQARRRSDQRQADALARFIDVLRCQTA